VYPTVVTGGVYPGVILDKNATEVAKQGCHPIRFQDERQRRWREQITARIARDVGFRVVPLDFADPAPRTGKEPVLYVIPFCEVTAAALDMHNVHLGGSFEPTHYCSSPYTWEHVYDRLYRAMLSSSEMLREMPPRAFGAHLTRREKPPPPQQQQGEGGEEKRKQELSPIRAELLRREHRAGSLAPRAAAFMR
jgi:hypothetical protein